MKISAHSFLKINMKLMLSNVSKVKFYFLKWQNQITATKTASHFYNGQTEAKKRFFFRRISGIY